MIEITLVMYLLFDFLKKGESLDRFPLLHFPDEFIKIPFPSRIYLIRGLSRIFIEGQIQTCRSTTPSFITMASKSVHWKAMYSFLLFLESTCYFEKDEFFFY